MTVVAGFVNREAVVLSADSREVISDYSKKSTQKIRVYMNLGQWTIGIAGSSDYSPYLDLFESELVTKLRKFDEFDSEEFLSVIKGTIHQIHKQHIWPRRWDRPSFNTLIAIQPVNPPGFPMLVSTEDTAVLRVRDYKCVGVGQHMADYLKKVIFPFDDDIRVSPAERLINAGVFIVKEVKKAIHGCDGETNVAIFAKDGDFRFLNSLEVLQIEGWLTTLAHSNAELFKAVVNPHMDEEAFGKTWMDFKQKIENLRNGQASVTLDAFTPRKGTPSRMNGIKSIKRSISRKSKGQR